jgi:hypothetical protein
MEIKNKSVLVLGGWGLVGMAICRKLLEDKPKEIIVCSLEKWQAEEACKTLSKEAGDVTLTPVWGNVFVRQELKDKTRNEILNNPHNRNFLIHDVFSTLTEDILEQSFLFHIIKENHPEIVIDCVNSATALAYQDIYTSFMNVNKELEVAKTSGTATDSCIAEVEKMVATIYLPQLIRHVQILYEAMRRVKAHSYVKIGTSGTGGMGLNIPYTHSEEKPSRVLLSKSAIAGAHSMLLFLMGRTPDAPFTKEIKPAAAIAWKRIAYGDITRGGKPIELFDCPPDNPETIGDTFNRQSGDNHKPLGNTLKSVFVDTGENGIFSLGEFYTISALGQMEYVTPEEIAQYAIWEIKGGNTGTDIISSMDNAIMGPTYRAGYLRESVLKKMETLEQEHGVESVAFELLGPPRLSKLLHEANLLRRGFKTMQKVLDGDPEQLSDELEKLIRNDQDLRSKIISIGIPILMKDGKSLLRGPTIKIPPYRGSDQFTVTDESIDEWAKDGWVDLQPDNMKRWQERFRAIQKEIDVLPEDDTSSRYHRDRQYWLEDEEIHIGKVVSWIFIIEEEGLRIKS